MNKLRHMFGRRAFIDETTVAVGTVSANSDAEREILIQVTGVTQIWTCRCCGPGWSCWSHLIPLPANGFRCPMTF